MNLVQSLIGLFVVFATSLTTSYVAPGSTIKSMPMSIATQSIIMPVIEDKVQKIDTTECSCVRTAIKYGLSIPLVDAKDLIPDSSPIIGGGILFYYPRTKTHHVGVITNIEDDHFEIIEGNFKPCELSKRKVSFDDPFIIGFIK